MVHTDVGGPKSPYGGCLTAGEQENICFRPATWSKTHFQLEHHQVTQPSQSYPEHYLENLFKTQLPMRSLMMFKMVFEQKA
jgi:hypothetical protein